MTVVFLCAFGYETNRFLTTREPNYFEVLELENTMPSPVLVKKRYKEISNKMAAEEGFDSNKKAKSEKKQKLQEVYDCLMFS
jgi:hypothetical protein